MINKTIKRYTYNGFRFVGNEPEPFSFCTFVKYSSFAKASRAIRKANNDETIVITSVSESSVKYQMTEETFIVNAEIVNDIVDEME